MRRSQYAFRISDKETRSAICLFAHILGEVKYLLTLLALPHTGRDTDRGEKGNCFHWAFLKACSRYRVAMWLIQNTV